MTMLAILLAQAAILSPPPAPDPHSVAVPQLSPKTASDARVSQITSNAPRQSVQVQRVAGRDRCQDPSKAQDSVCRAAVEQRASHYPPVDRTPLSNDQRAVAERRIVNPRSDAAAAERRIAQGNLDPDMPSAQNVAAATSSERPTAGSDPAETGLSDLQRAIISGVIVPSDVSNAETTPK